MSNIFKHPKALLEPLEPCQRAELIYKYSQLTDCSGEVFLFNLSELMDAFDELEDEEKPRREEEN